jgi:hypothetical protein
MAPELKPRSIAFAAAVCLGLFALAFAIAPRSCEGGLSAYVVTGLAAVGALFAVPFVSQPGLPLGVRLPRGLALGLLGSGVWAVGLFAADVRIVCQLF